MLKNIPPNLLHAWSNNFVHNQALPFITRSALIELVELQSFIDAAKEQHAKAVRIYSIRFAENETPFLPPPGTTALPEGCKWVAAGNGLSQGSFAMVPVDEISIGSDFVFSGNDVVQGSLITTLIPGSDRKGTGHCPPGSCETSNEPPPGDGSK